MAKVPPKFAAECLQKAKNGRIEGQQKVEPEFWIEVTKGQRGFFAVKIWDGMGHPEPWESGEESFVNKSNAVDAARQWADMEELEFKQ